MNGWTCLNIQEIYIVRRQSVLRVTTRFHQMTKLLLCQSFKEYKINPLYKIQWIKVNVLIP